MGKGGFSCHSLAGQDKITRAIPQKISPLALKQGAAAQHIMPYQQRPLCNGTAYLIRLGGFSCHSLAASVAAVCHGFFYTPYRTGLTAARGADTGALVVPVSSEQRIKKAE